VDQRGIGIQSTAPANNPPSGSQSREAKPELVLQTGYSNFFGATRMVFSPDGRLLATGTFRSSTVKLWDTATGRELRDLSSGTQSGTAMSPSIAFSRDSHFVAATAGNNSVKVWDVASGREVQTLASSQAGMAATIGGVYFIAFTADGRLVTISDAIRVWNIASGQEVRAVSLSTMNVAGFMGGADGAAITPDGSQLAYIDSDSGSQVKFLDLGSGRVIRSVDLDDKDLQSPEMGFASDGHLMVAGLIDRHIKLWNVTSRKDERDFGTTANEYDLIKFSSDGRVMALASGYKIKFWEVATARELSTLQVPSNGLSPQFNRIFVSFSDDGKKLASGGFDTPMVIWETETGKQLLTLNGRTNMSYKVAFSADGTSLTSGGRTRWDLRTGRGLRIASGVTDKGLEIPSPDGRLLAVIRPFRNSITILETPAGRVLYTLAPAASGGSVQRAVFSPDNTMLVTTYSADAQQASAGVGMRPSGIENTAKIWDLKSGRELRSLALNGTAMEVSFSPDSRVVATIGIMGEVSLWDVQSGSRLRDLTSSPIPSPTSMGGFGNLRSIKPGQIPTMPNLAELSTMMTNMMGSLSAGTMGRTVTSVVFSPDGQLVATGGVESKSNFDFAAMMSGNVPGQKKPKNKKAPDPQDLMRDMKVEATGHVVLWDSATGREVASITGHGKGVTQVAFSRDGKRFASASTDNTIKIWDLATRRELKTLVGHTANVESMDFSPDGRLLASASDDGGTFLWDASTGEHLLTLISLDDGGEWMVVTPQGLFDGTPLSWNQILWRYNQDTFNVAPIEWFFTEFYCPGLLADVFAGNRPRVTLDVSKKDRRQPIVKLTVSGDAGAAVTARTVKVRIDVTEAAPDKDNSQGSGARDVRLFRNGALVRVWRGDVLQGKSAVTLEDEVTIAAGANRLTAYAFNKDNVKSKDAQLPLTGAETLKRLGTAYVIAVGINEYANPQYNLKYAVADAQSFGEEVRRRLSSVTRFERFEVIPLLNENATKANILSALKRLAGSPEPPSLKADALSSIKRAEPEDTIIIYYAGHGTAQAQRFYLVPHDLGYTGDRTKLDEQGLKTILAHSISDVELEQAVEDLDAGHLLLIIDACNSGQALEAEEKRRGPMNSKGLAQLAYEKGMYILTAAQSYQAALEAAQLGHGLLTYVLVEEGLKTQAADTEPKDGIVSAREWLDFATERVPQMQEDKMKQARGVGLQLAFTEGEQKIAEPEKRTVQRPRVFYRRELEMEPLVIAKP